MNHVHSVLNQVRIHLDAIESGLETIIKQIALHSIGGLSVGKLRSYPMSIDFWYFYPNDVFFSWGLDTAKRINSTNENIENILTSGFPYAATKNKPNSEAGNIVAKLKSKNTKFNILLLDSNYSINNLDQFIEKSTMIGFYQIFMDWVLEDEDIGLIIKPKKSASLASLPEVITQYEGGKKKTGLREDRKIMRMSLKYRRKSSNDIVKDMKEEI